MNKYGPKARKTIEQSMDQFKKGKLRNGRSGKKVTNRNQAIAIGLSEAQHRGYKTPSED